VRRVFPVACCRLPIGINKDSGTLSFNLLANNDVIKLSDSTLLKTHQLSKVTVNISNGSWMIIHLATVDGNKK